MVASLRFGIFSHNMGTLSHLLTQATRAEQLGYSTFLIPDHIGDELSSVLALAAIASKTARIRLGSFVFDNDFRNPALLAKDIATLDVLSNGRFEFGIGAGWMESEYEQIGLAFDSPKVRIERLEESLHIIKALLRGERVTTEGINYRIKDLSVKPHVLQQPHPPVLVGGSGKRLLFLAGREASIISFTPRTVATEVRGHMNNALDIEDASFEALDQKVSWVKASASASFAALELNLVVLDVALASNREQALLLLEERNKVERKAIERSPYFLFGSPEEVCAQIVQARDRLGISYWTVWEEHLETFAPIVSRLRGV